MTDIWRHRVYLDDGANQQFMAPISARVVNAMVREGAKDSSGMPVVDVWFEVANDAIAEAEIPIGLAIVGTGTGEVPGHGWFRYVSTIQLNQGEFVGHIYVDDGKTGMGS